MKTQIDIAAAPAAPSFGAPVPAPLVRPRKDFPRVLASFDKAVAAHVLEGPAVQVGQSPLQRDDIRAGLAPLLDLYAQLDRPVKATQKVRLQIAAQTPATYQYVKSIKVALTSHLGANHPLLPAFGIAGPKRRALSVGEKFVKTQRSQRTRKLRGTLGPRQRQQIKFQGELEATVAEAPD